MVPSAVGTLRGLQVNIVDNTLYLIVLLAVTALLAPLLSEPKSAAPRTNFSNLIALSACATTIFLRTKSRRAVSLLVATGGASRRQCPRPCCQLLSPTTTRVRSLLACRGARRWSRMEQQQQTFKGCCAFVIRGARCGRRRHGAQGGAGASATACWVQPRCGAAAQAGVPAPAGPGVCRCGPPGPPGLEAGRPGNACQAPAAAAAADTICGRAEIAAAPQPIVPELLANGQHCTWAVYLADYAGAAPYSELLLAEVLRELR